MNVKETLDALPGINSHSYGEVKNVINVIMRHIFQLILKISVY